MSSVKIARIYRYGALKQAQGKSEDEVFYCAGFPLFILLLEKVMVVWFVSRRKTV